MEEKGAKGGREQKEKGSYLCVELRSCSHSVQYVGEDERIRIGIAVLQVWI